MLVSACGGESPEALLASAKRHLEGKDYKAAQIELKSALQRNPSLAEARFLLGRSLYLDGAYANAVIELKKAEELGYAQPQVAPLLAKSYVGLRQFQKLLAEFEDLDLSEAKPRAELQAALATAHFAQGQLEQGDAVLSSALRADPDSLDAQLLRVRRTAIAKQLDEAMRLLDGVLAKHSESAAAWMLKGDLHGAKQDEQARNAAYQEALKRDPQNLTAHSVLIQGALRQQDMERANRQFAMLRKELPGHPQTAYLAALIALQAGDVERARAQIQQALKLVPDDIQALFLAAGIELRAGALTQAEQHVSKALAKAPERAELRQLLATVQLRGGDREKSLATLRPLLNAEQPGLEALALAGEAEFLGGNVQQAAKYFARVLDRKPEDLRARTVAALGRIELGQHEQGVRELQLVSSRDPSAVADLSLIGLHMQKREFDEALRVIDALEKKQPKQAQPLYLRALAELARGKPVLARQALEAALKLEPAHFPSLNALAKLDLRDGQAAKALTRMERAAADAPGNLDLQMGLFALKEQTKAPRGELVALLEALVGRLPSAPGPRLALARLAMEDKQYKQAVSRAQDGLAVIPNDPALLEMLGRAQAASGELNQAAISYGKLAAALPKSPVPHMLLADLQRANKDWDGAVLSLKRALSVQSDALPAQTALIMAELQRAKPDEARGVAALVQRQRPQEPVGFLLAAEVERTQKNWAAAELAYRTALQKKGGAQTETALRLHGMLLESNQAAAAAAFEASWRKGHAGDAMFVAYLGESALRRNDFQAAQRHYTEVVRLQPENAAAMNNLAWLLVRVGDKANALKTAQQVNRLAPNQAPYLDTLAEAHASLGEWAPAIDTQRRALQLSGEQPMYRLHLARYLQAAGRHGEAKAELQRLVQLGDKFPAQDQVRALLAAK